MSALLGPGFYGTLVHPAVDELDVASSFEMKVCFTRENGEGRWAFDSDASRSRGGIVALCFRTGSLTVFQRQRRIDP